MNHGVFDSKNQFFWFFDIYIISSFFNHSVLLYNSDEDNTILLTLTQPVAGFALDTPTKCDTTISHEFLGKITNPFLCFSADGGCD